MSGLMKEKAFIMQKLEPRKAPPKLKKKGHARGSAEPSGRNTMMRGIVKTVSRSVRGPTKEETKKVSFKCIDEDWSDDMEVVFHPLGNPRASAASFLVQVGPEYGRVQYNLEKYTPRHPPDTHGTHTPSTPPGLPPDTTRTPPEHHLDTPGHP